MTTFSKLFSSLLVATFALASVPALADEPVAPAAAAPCKGACACESGHQSALKTFLFEKDELGTTRVVRWGVGAAGVAAMVVAAVTTGAVVGAIAVVPQCRNNAAACKAMLTQPFGRNNGNQVLGGSNTGVGASNR